jgi:hypothetical protein
MKDNFTGEYESPKISREAEPMKNVRIELGSLFDNYYDPAQRTVEIIDKIEPFFRHIDKAIFSVEKIEEIKDALRSCENILNKKEFLDKVIEILKPIFDVKESHIGAFEEAQMNAMNETGKYNEINRLLSYGKSGSIIHIHAAPGKSVGNKIALYREGMIKLAEIVNDDPEVKQITATSFLVEEHPGLFETAGFTVDGIVAKINREEFLARFLND